MLHADARSLALPIWSSDCSAQHLVSYCLPGTRAAFMGQMADIRVWSVARTDDQIRQSYKTTVPANAEVRSTVLLACLCVLPPLLSPLALLFLFRLEHPFAVRCVAPWLFHARASASKALLLRLCLP